MYRTLLFDLDGTLAETDSLHLPTWVDALMPHGIEVDEVFYRENISGRANAEIVEDLLPNLPESDGQKIVETKEASFRERAGDLAPLPGLLDLLERAKESRLRTGLVTNAPRENVAAVLLALGLEDFFDAVVPSEDVSAAKPDPEPYATALEKLGAQSDETLAFEDSVSGIRSAVGAGIATVGIASTQEPETLREAGAFVVVADFTNAGLRALVGA